MAFYEFCGPGAFVFPELAGPPGEGTLTAIPGRKYEFGGDPPGPRQWWIESEASSTPETVKVVPGRNPPADAPVQEG